MKFVVAIVALIVLAVASVAFAESTHVTTYSDVSCSNSLGDVSGANDNCVSLIASAQLSAVFTCNQLTQTATMRAYNSSSSNQCSTGAINIALTKGACLQLTQANAPGNAMRYNSCSPASTLESFLF